MISLLRCGDALETAIVWLTKLFNLIFLGKQDARRMEAEYISTNLQE
uniref:Uncharacterized protein n=1 Tax=Arundo donax TaxID=35708 RepID=A0A0A9D828_ARUDO